MAPRRVNRVSAVAPIGGYAYVLPDLPPRSAWCRNRAMEAPGSRILLRPGGLGRSGRLCPSVPGLGRLPGPDPLDDPGVVPISARDPDRGHRRHPDRPD